VVLKQVSNDKSCFQLADTVVNGLRNKKIISQTPVAGVQLKHFLAILVTFAV
jgi:hypothetical protein